MSKTLIAAATAATIGLGALAATATPAAAAGGHGGYGVAHFSGPGFSVTIGNNGWHRGRDFRRDCRPIFKNQRVWIRHHGWTWAKVKVGERCDRPHRQHRRWW